MAKKKVTIEAGELRKVYVYTPPMPRDGERARAERSKITSAAQKKLNYRTAQSNLELLIACNFKAEDLFVTLTYDNEHLPKTRKEALKNIKNYIRQLREIRSKQEKEFNYIYNTEDKHGAGRFHHHMIINSVDKNDMEMIISMWKYSEPNGVDIERLMKGKTDGRQYIDIARYMTKEAAEEKPNDTRMYVCSRNLKRPRKYYEWIKDNETVEIPRSAELLEHESFINQWGEFIYIKYLERESPAVNTWRAGAAERLNL